MYPTIVDTETGDRKTLVNCDRSVFWWTEGNGSCDCNRAVEMGQPELLGDRSKCIGNRRFIAVDVHGDLEGWAKVEVIREMNEGYPYEAVARCAGS